MQQYPLLQTKLHIPPIRPELVSRPRLIERLNAGLHQNEGFGRKLTLISTPAGYGKTTLLSEWVAGCSRLEPKVRAAWLSLDEGDNDPIRFLAYLIAALQTLALPVPSTSWKDQVEGSGVERPVLSESEGTADGQEAAGRFGDGLLAVLQSPQPPPIEAILTNLLNETNAIPDKFVLVLDDYHVIDAKPVDAPTSVEASTSVDRALTFLLERLPPQMHLVIATREDPHLPLARLRARGQLTELRLADLRFTPSEAAEFLNQMMGLDLSAEDIAALEARTEGWIAGLQLASLVLQGTISLQGHKDVTSFIRSFTGSHRFVLDYLLEEVLEQQPESVKVFLLHTSILDRLCGPLCDTVRFGTAEIAARSGRAATPKGDAVRFSRAETQFSSFGTAVCSAGTAILHGDTALTPTPAATGQEILEYLERANLFTIPLDSERHWYRYHRLFAELLRQRLQRSTASPTGDEGAGGADYQNQLHIRASQWFEDNNLQLEAFHHAATANDVDRVERLISGGRLPQHFRGAVTAVLDWLESLPKTVLDARPWLWWRYASLLLVSGHTTGVEEKLQAAEAAIAEAAAAKAAVASAATASVGPQEIEPVLSGAEGPDDKARDLIGRIASARATLALTRYDPEALLVQSRRALEYLQPDSLLPRSSAYWTLGYAYFLQGDRTVARRALGEAIAISQTAGDTFTSILATIALGQVQEADNQLHQAAETYRRVLQMAGDQPLQIIAEAHLGLARVLYEWNDLDGAEQHGQQGLELARQYESVIDRFISCEVFLARLRLAQGDGAGAATILARADRSVRQHSFVHRTQEVATARVLALIHQGDLAAAARLAGSHKLPISQARVHLARKDASAALAVLEPVRQQVEAKGWEDEKLKVTILEALAYHMLGQVDEAVQLLDGALAMAEPGSFVRIFVDEGPRMARLLSEVAARGIMPHYIGKLLAAYESATKVAADAHIRRRAELTPSSLVEPLTEREIEVLQLIAEGLTNQQVADRLYLSLHTVKVHARNIYGKLGVKNRTQAVAKAKALGILTDT